MAEFEGQVRSTIAAVCATITLAAGPPAAQERYVRAEENEKHDLVVTTSAREGIVVAKSDRKWADQDE